jgi:CheY-like chemotaxis protein
MSTPKFLVVEDETDARSMICSMLKSLECDSVPADSGEAAIKVLAELGAKQDFDAIFLDVILPGISGLDLIQRLKDNPNTQKLPIVLLTSQNSGKDIMNGYSSGADYYITKPFTLEQLIYGLDMLFAQIQESDPEKKPVKVFKIDEVIPEENYDNF